MLQIIFEIVFQFLLEIVGEIIAESVLFVVLEKIKLGNGFGALVTPAYIVFGSVLGWLSHFMFSEHILQGHTVRMFSRVASPIALGLALCFISWIVAGRDRGERFFKFDKFMQGALFGVSYSILRSLSINP